MYIPVETQFFILIGCLEVELKPFTTHTVHISHFHCKPLSLLPPKYHGCGCVCHLQQYFMI